MCRVSERKNYVQERLRIHRTTRCRLARDPRRADCQGRKTVAFAANTGDAKAAERLKALHVDTVTLQAQREDMSSAIAEATVRLAVAEKAAKQIPVIKGAEARLTKARELPALLVRFDAAVKEVCETANLLRGGFAEADERSNWLAILGALRRALQGSLFGEGTKLHVEVYPPGQRGPAAVSLGPIVQRLERDLLKTIADANAELRGEQKRAA